MPHIISPLGLPLPHSEHNVRFIGTFASGFFRGGTTGTGGLGTLCFPRVRGTLGTLGTLVLGTLTDGLREGEALGLAGLAVMDGLGLLRGLVMAFTVRIPGSVPREVVPPREVSPPREVIERTERTSSRYF